MYSVHKEYVLSFYKLILQSKREKKKKEEIVSLLLLSSRMRMTHAGNMSRCAIYVDLDNKKDFCYVFILYLWLYRNCSSYCKCFFYTGICCNLFSFFISICLI